MAVIQEMVDLSMLIIWWTEVIDLVAQCSIQIVVAQSIAATIKGLWSMMYFSSTSIIWVYASLGQQEESLVLHVDYSAQLLAYIDIIYWSQNELYM